MRLPIPPSRLVRIAVQLLLKTLFSATYSCFVFRYELKSDSGFSQDDLIRIKSADESRI
ncbi:MAG: hypothetical protein IT528_09655 [Nitrosomonas sp.]|nr:hypothetical protein [Nitrosomonas sp.]